MQGGNLILNVKLWASVELVSLIGFECTIVKLRVEEVRTFKPIGLNRMQYWKGSSEALVNIGLIEKG